MAGPLAGVRVIDAAAVIAGPFGAAMLGDFGAEVIKVEMPKVGDSSRGMGPFYKGEPLRWATYGRNKKTVTLDLRKPEGKEIFLKLTTKSDIIFENFRTGTFDKWGLDYATLQKANPGIIVVRITGYGQTGPNAHLAGFGTPATGFSGLTGITGHPDKPPVSPPISLADYLAGLYAAYAAIACLYHRDVRQGPGQEVDTSLYEGIFRLLEGPIAAYDKLGQIQERSPTIAGASPSGTYRTKDDKWAVLVCSTDRTFEYLAHAMNRADMLQDPRYNTNAARVAHGKEVDAVIIDWMAKLSYPEVKDICDKAGVPVNLVYTMADIFTDPHYAARENLVEVQHPTFGTIKIPSVVPKLSKTPGEIKWPGPAMGAYNKEVYEDLLGMKPADVAELQEKGVI
jgi:formyl-CoA transferase